MPDFFHVMHDLVKHYSLARGQRVRQAHQAHQQAHERLRKLQERLHRETEALEAEASLETSRAEVQRWEEGQRVYRRSLEVFSFALHPCRLRDSAPQTSAQVATHLQNTLKALEGFVQQYALPARPAVLTKVRKQLPALAALVDTWWHDVKQELETSHLSPAWQTWAEASFLALVYWEQHWKHTRCPRKKAQLRHALEQASTPFHAHPITQQMALPVLETWHAWAYQRIKAFQRTSSAVEGRNGMLSQRHHNQRGLPRNRYKVWTILHNLACRTADGTTPAGRFFQRTCPDLFETVVPAIEALPQPRRRKPPRALSMISYESVPL